MTGSNQALWSLLTAFSLSTFASANSIVPIEQQDEGYRLCVKHHSEHLSLATEGEDGKSVPDTYAIERTLCRSADQRKNYVLISECLKKHGDPKSTYESVDLCTRYADAPLEIESYKSCVATEAKAKAALLPSSPTFAHDSLYLCKSKFFRENMDDVRRCALDNVKLWSTGQPLSSAQSAALSTSLLLPCADGQLRAELPQIAKCTFELSQAHKLTWQKRKSPDYEIAFLETCLRPDIRKHLKQVIACKEDVGRVADTAAKSLKIYADLMGGKEPESLTKGFLGGVRNFEAQIRVESDKCYNDLNYRMHHAAILSCAISKVTSDKQRPFVDLVPINPANFEYVVDLASRKCRGEHELKFQENVGQCEEALEFKASKLELDRKLGEYSNDKVSTNLICQMIVSRELSVKALGLQDILGLKSSAADSKKLKDSTAPTVGEHALSAGSAGQ